MGITTRAPRSLSDRHRSAGCGSRLTIGGRSFQPLDLLTQRARLVPISTNKRAHNLPAKRARPQTYSYQGCDCSDTKSIHTWRIKHIEALGNEDDPAPTEIFICKGSSTTLVAVLENVLGDSLTDQQTAADDWNIPTGGEFVSLAEGTDGDARAEVTGVAGGAATIKYSADDATHPPSLEETSTGGPVELGVNSINVEFTPEAQQRAVNGVDAVYTLAPGGFIPGGITFSYSPDDAELMIAYDTEKKEITVTPGENAENYTIYLASVDCASCVSTVYLDVVEVEITDGGTLGEYEGMLSEYGAEEPMTLTSTGDTNGLPSGFTYHWHCSEGGGSFSAASGFGGNGTETASSIAFTPSADSSVPVDVALVYDFPGGLPDVLAACKTIAVAYGDGRTEGGRVSDDYEWALKDEAGESVGTIEPVVGTDMRKVTITPNCDFADYATLSVKFGVVDSEGGIEYHTNRKSVVIIKIDSVEAYCNKFGASGSFGENNPEVFDGQRTDFGQPHQPPPYWWLPGTYSNPSSQVLKVFFKYVKNANDEPGPFDIDLKANFLPPEAFPDDQLNITWVNWAAPSASGGSFDKTDEREVKFRNVAKGGLYKFRIEMRPPGLILQSHAWVLLPMAGGEISEWIVDEVPSLVARAATWETAVRAVAVSNSWDEDDFLDIALKAIASYDFDYQGIVGVPTKRYSFVDSDRPAGHTPDESIPGMRGLKGNGDWDEPSYATLKGIVVHRAKINNAMYAVWGRELGYSASLLQAGAYWNAASRDLWDDSTSQNAVALGSDLYDAHSIEGNLSAILTKSRAKAIQSEDTIDGLNDVNLWPNTVPSFGFTLGNMPTEYESLIVGTNIITASSRGRLFMENGP